MKAAAVVIASLLLAAGAARAGLSQADLAVVAAAPPPGATLDPNLAARDPDGDLRSVGSVLDGKPAFLVFADYTCTTLCRPILAMLADAIERARLETSAFRILVLGIDPKDTVQSARAMERGEIPADLRAATVFLLPDAATVDAAVQSLGYRFAYDASADQFAHPAAIYVLAADGTVKSVLSPFALNTADLAAILASAPPPRSGLYQSLRLLCYAYDPVTGAYSARIDVLLKLAAGATIVALGCGLLLLMRRRGG